MGSVEWFAEAAGICVGRLGEDFESAEQFRREVVIDFLFFIFDR